MRASVADTFPAFTASFEGRTTWPYRDVKGLVTVACGNLIDPLGEAMGLPWQVDGRPATDAEIRAGWEAVKALPPAMRASAYALAVPPLRLTEGAIDELVRRRAGEMDRALASRFPGWESLPADAQLGTISLAWACGPAFAFPRFSAALQARDFATCADECGMDVVGNLGLVPRNAANRALFLAAVTSTDPDVVSGWAG